MAESGEARIVLVTQQEGVVDESRDTVFAMGCVSRTGAPGRALPVLLAIAAAPPRSQQIGEQNCQANGVLRGRKGAPRVLERGEARAELCRVRSRIVACAAASAGEPPDSCKIQPTAPIREPEYDPKLIAACGDRSTIRVSPHIFRGRL